MRTTHPLRGVAVIATLALPAAASLAGPIYQEPRTDAGPQPFNAAKTAPESDDITELTSIWGQLTGGRGVGSGDYQDMYQIRIDDPANFTAASAPRDGEPAFDTQLWLFDESGRGILGNDESPIGAAGQSFLSASATDGSGAAVLTPGLYYIAISGAGSVPTSGGLEIFAIANRFEVSGPDGPAGTGLIDGWAGNGATGVYAINLTGATFAIPAPAAAALFMLAAPMALRRKR